MFGPNNLSGCDRFISSLTGRWGMAKLVSSYRQTSKTKLEKEQGFLHAETISNILRARTKKQFFWFIGKRRSKSKFSNIGLIDVLKRELEI